jgi:hypothetical protein
MSGKTAFALIWKRYGALGCRAFIFSTSAAGQVMPNVAVCGLAVKRRKSNVSEMGGTA